MKIFTQSVYILCRDREKFVQHIFFMCVAASGNISCFLRNMQLLLKDINVRLLLKENMQLKLFVFKQMCGCLWKHFMFIEKRAAASERYQYATAYERKCTAAS